MDRTIVWMYAQNLNGARSKKSPAHHVVSRVHENVRDISEIIAVRVAEFEVVHENFVRRYPHDPRLNEQ